MALVDLGSTTHFVVRYEGAVAGSRARAQAVLDTAERDLARCAVYLPYATGGGQDPYLDDYRVAVQVIDLVDNRGGARNDYTGGAGHKRHTIYIGAINQSGGQVSDDFARFLFVAELAEVLMRAYGYEPADSRGEALSRVMAEELYPAQAYGEGFGPWVNGWLNTNPRDFQYLGAPEKNDNNALSYGIGILYLNWLRSQLGFSLVDICGAGGSQLADTYRSLTHQPNADAVAPFRDLLQRFYPAGKPVTLLTNDPFPLIDPPQRGAWVQVRQSRVPGLAGLLEEGVSVGGTVRVSPFIGCPVEDYSYTIERHPRQVDVVVTTQGFARPRFAWTVNATPLSGSSGTRTVEAEGTYDVPDDPRTPKHAVASFTFHYAAADEFSWRGLSHRLVLRNLTHDGHVRLDLTVAVTDAAGGNPDPTTVTFSTTIDASTVVYEQRFYDDRNRCARHLHDAVESHNRGLAEQIDLVRTLPDPPPPYVSAALVAALANVRRVFESGEVEPAVAVDAARLVAAHLGAGDEHVRALLGVQTHRE